MGWVRLLPVPIPQAFTFTPPFTSSQKSAKSRTGSLSFLCSLSNPFSYSLFILGVPLLSACLANVF